MKGIMGFVQLLNILRKIPGSFRIKTTGFPVVKKDGKKEPRVIVSLLQFKR